MVVAVLSRGRDRFAVLVHVDDNVLGVHSNISHVCDNIRNDVLASPVFVLLLTYLYCQTMSTRSKPRDFLR